MSVNREIGLPAYFVDDPGLPVLPRDELRALQDERLAAMVGYVYEHGPFWRRKLAAAGIGPGDISGVADIRRLPTCDKAELLAAQQAHPPFGDYTCTPPERWQKLFTTSGTTGRPLRRLLSRRDWRMIIEWTARRPRLVGPDEIILLTTPVDGLMAATVVADATAELGGLVVQAGTRADRQKAELISELRPAVVVGPPSYLLHLAEMAAGDGLDLSGAGIRMLLAWGEPGAAVPATNRLLVERYGVTGVIDGLGITELGPLGGNCPFSSDMHLSEDLFVVECLRPGSADPVPPGEVGELVFTDLVGDTQPLLRFRTGDLGVLSDGSPCACGSTHLRIVGSVQGRVDDMIWYRGANIFPSAVEAVLRDLPDLGPEYRLVRGQDASGTTLAVLVESRRALDEAGQGALAARIAEALRPAVRDLLPVEVLAPGTLPRGDGLHKIRRLYDAAAPNRTAASQPAGPPA